MASDDDEKHGEPRGEGREGEVLWGNEARSLQAWERPGERDKLLLL